MWNDDVCVCESKIEGKGLIAKRDIYKDEVIVDYRYLDCWFEIAVTDLSDYQIRIEKDVNDLKMKSYGYREYKKLVVNSNS